MTAYFAPSGSSLNFTWNGASYYTAPSGSPLNFDFTTFSYPKIVGNVDLELANSSLAAFVPPPYSIIGGVDLEFASQFWSLYHEEISFQGLIFETQALQGSMVVSLSEQLDVESLLPSFASDIRFIRPFEVSGTLAGLLPVITLSKTGDFTGEAQLSGLSGDLVFQPIGDVSLNYTLAGLKMDAALLPYEGIAFEGRLLPGLEVAFAGAGEFATAVTLPLMTSVIGFESPIAVSGYLPGLNRFIEFAATTDITVRGTLPSFKASMTLEHGEWRIASTLRGLDSDFVLSIRGSLDATCTLPVLRAEIDLDPTLPVTVQGYLPGLTFNGFRPSGLDLELELPHFRGERVFDTPVGCSTRYL